LSVHILHKKQCIFGKNVEKARFPCVRLKRFVIALPSFLRSINNRNRQKPVKGNHQQRLHFKTCKYRKKDEQKRQQPSRRKQETSKRQKAIFHAAP
jgi:hypothetical protein